MKVLFLDIDGVLQPGGRQNRFKHMDEYPELTKRLNEELPGDFDYYAYINEHNVNVYDLGAVYYDWDKPAVERLRRVLDTTGAKVVLSSSWRENGMTIMRALMAIHQLDKYLIGATYCITLDEMRSERNDEYYAKDEAGRAIFEKIEESMVREPWNIDSKRDYVPTRSAEIREYLDRYPEITAYVAVDDDDLERGLNGHFVGTYHLLEDEHARQCIDILNREDGPYTLNKEEYADELEDWRKKYID